MGVAASTEARAGRLRSSGPQPSGPRDTVYESCLEWAAAHPRPSPLSPGRPVMEPQPKAGNGFALSLPLAPTSPSTESRSPLPEQHSPARRAGAQRSAAAGAGGVARAGGALPIQRRPQAGASPPRLSAARRESGSRGPWLGEAPPQPECCSVCAQKAPARPGLPWSCPPA